MIIVPLSYHDRSIKTERTKGDSGSCILLLSIYASRAVLGSEGWHRGPSALQRTQSGGHVNTLRSKHAAISISFPLMPPQSCILTTKEWEVKN